MTVGAGYHCPVGSPDSPVNYSGAHPRETREWPVCLVLGLVHQTLSGAHWTLSLYRLLRKIERFAWMLEAEEALEKLKKLLSNTPILVPPAEGESLLLYIAATTQVVSVVIILERKEEGHAL
jgi:hypothetical protein